MAKDTKKKELTFILNGEETSLEIDPSKTLAEVLRYDLGLTGTKIGCNEAECGSCTVIIDGEPITSCVYPALKAQGAAVTTIEGLSSMAAEGDEEEVVEHQKDGEKARVHLHPLQKAFIDQGATQCGFCTPGMIMTAKALLDKIPKPTEEQIKTALKDTYCRCTGYRAILDAVKQASGQLDDVLLPKTKQPLSAVGQPLPRPDAVEKVDGSAKFADDYSFPGMLYGATKRALVPHAKILNIDVSTAKALDGVHGVLTAEDIPGDKHHGLIYNDWPVLCSDKVRYVGDAVAIVAADTPEIAKKAVELIEVEYEELEVVPDPVLAAKEDAPQIHAKGNLLKHIHVSRGDIEKGFAEADVVVENTYHTPTTDHVFLEPECSIARYGEDGKLEVYVGSQIPFEDRRQIAKSLGLEEEQVRVRGTLIGGGFGGKEDIAGQIHAALLTQKTGKPVKILYSRRESLLAHPKRHATVITIKTGAKRDGTLTAVKAELYGDTGDYASLGDKVMTRATTHAAGPYNVDHVKIDCYAMYTNNPPAGAFRGFGVTQSAFAVESNMDILAEEIGIDPLEFRRLNALRVGTKTTTGQVLKESVGMEKSIDAIEEELKEPFDVDGVAYRFEDPWKPLQVGEKVYAWGMASAYKNTGLGGGAPDKSGAEVEVFEDGTAEVRAGGAEIGQGLVGVVVQVTAQELGLPFEKVKALMSDTDLTPDGGPTTASRQTYTSGNAARLAAGKVRDILLGVVSERLDISPNTLHFREGVISGNGESVTLGQAVKWVQEEGLEAKARVMYEAPQTQPLGEPGDMHFAYSYASQAALVEVNTGTGEVKVLRIVGAFDVGRAINPMALLGQIEGGAAMGIGNCLTEEFITEDGQVYTDRLGHYKMPSIKHMPEFVTHVIEEETEEGPYGAKGVGEISSIPTSPAITNAIANAYGVRVKRLPVDQDRLLRAKKAGKSTVE
ncbi:MAG: molybdopterin cofactor-binding domain-containing protein [Anaerolineales bacterium]